MEPAFDAVVSYAPADRPLAERLADRLVDAGLRIFLLEWVAPGLIPIAEKEAAIAGTANGVLVFSRATMADPAIVDDYAALLRRVHTGGRRFIPVPVDDVDLPPFAAIRQPVHLGGDGGDEYDAQVDRLVRALRPTAAPDVVPGHRAPASGRRVRILMLAANPMPGAKLALDEEAREITEQLRLSRERDRFELITSWAVSPGGLLQAVNEHRPHVVHFSGHGTSAGEIVLVGRHGGHQPVTPDAMAAMFAATPDDTRIVLLNACYSAAQADAIARHIDFIIGMAAPINDQAATIFAPAFYSALGFGRSVQEAFDQSVAALMLHGMPDHDVPRLIVRAGVDAHTVL